MRRCLYVATSCPAALRSGTQRHSWRSTCRLSAAHRRQLLIDRALVLREAVEDAAGGGGVEEEEGRAQHVREHARVEARACAQRRREPAQVAAQREHDDRCTQIPVMSCTCLYERTLTVSRHAKPCEMSTGATAGLNCLMHTRAQTDATAPLSTPRSQCQLRAERAALATSAPYTMSHFESSCAASLSFDHSASHHSDRIHADCPNASASATAAELTTPTAQM